MNIIALSKINLKAPTQLRSTGEDMTHVEDLAYSYADTGSFTELPWVALIKDTNEYVPIDGFHRLMALQWLAEQENIECQVDLDNVSVRLTEFDTMSEAIVAAAGVNANHGLKRKSTDIYNAIQKLLEVDRIGFSKTKYTLDSESIMKVVKCSSATYRRATEEIRKELTDARDFEVKRLNYEGNSQREIQLRTGVPQKTISRILSESERSVSKTTHPYADDPQGLDDQKRHDGRTSQSVDPLQEFNESKPSMSKVAQDEYLDGLAEEKRSMSKIPQSISGESQGLKNCSVSESLHKEAPMNLGTDKAHNAENPQDHIEKRKANLIESITHQLSSLSVEQLKSVDGHIATVSDF